MNKVTYPKDVLEKMQEIVDGCMGESAPYCQAACPMHTDVKGYVNLIGEGKYEEALLLIREQLFLPGTLGRICAHPCEKACKRNEEFNRPISIAGLKRFASEKADDKKLWDVKKKASTGKRVAIIGAGPAGAQGAIDLSKEGHSVTIYDKLEVFGGMMRVGIPEYRLPRDIIDFEYSYLKELGVEFKMGVEIGKDIPFEKLQKDYDAVLIAVGAHKGSKIPVPGHDLEGSYHAVEYLKEISLTHDFKGAGKKVAVVGGGDVAMDCARSSLRIGAEEVHVLCLEPEDKMPANAWEIEEALEEGVNLHAGFGPEKIIDKNGHVAGFEIKKCTSIFDKEGKFNPKYDMKNKKVLDVDTVIFAVGQQVDNDFVNGKIETTRGGRFVVDADTLQSSIDNVFVAGDASGTVIVIQAMAHARKAAASIDRYLKGADLKAGRDFEKEMGYETDLETTLKEDVEDLPRLTSRQLDPKKRIQSFVEADLGFNEEDALKEARRCLVCECKLCMQECVMLNDFCECPKDLFENIIETGEVEPIIPYSCNMCSQCTIACPKDFPMKDRFMEMRKVMIKANDGKSPMKGHNAIEMHQMLGFSKVFNTAKPATKSADTNKKNKGRA